MFTKSLLALATVAAVATSTVSAGCSFCRYAAWNCSVEEAILNETTVLSTSVRKEAHTEAPLSVCDADGNIQVDDVFCDDNDCACVAGKRCASLTLGCQNIFKARSRKRCIGDSTVQHRFQSCVVTPGLTTQATANLDGDWVHFRNVELCKSSDCVAVQQFHQCGAVECGRLVVAWKESETEYRFVVDGSRASDMDAGTFLFSATKGSSLSCPSITSTKIPNCYSLQTRNQKNGTCDGIYLQADTNLLAADESHRLSDLEWGIYSLVVGSVVAAVASVASVIFVVLRHRRERQQEERSGLLPGDSAQLKTPDLGPDDLQDDLEPTARNLRQRPLSPRD